MGEGSGEAAAYSWWRSSLSCKTQLGQGRGEISHESGRWRNNKCLPMIWGWSVPYLPYVLCLVVGPVSCSESCTALASAQPSFFPLHRGFLVPCKDPSPYPRHSTSWFLAMEGLADAIPTPDVHTWSVSPRVCSHLLLTVHQCNQCWGLRGSRTPASAPIPRL